MSLRIAFEGDTDLPVARKLAEDAGLSVALTLDCKGKGGLDRDLLDFLGAAATTPYLVLRDLDNDAPCAPAFLRDRAFAPTTFMCFRIVVREMEAWLMADRVGLAKFLNVEARWIPEHPDALVDPTGELIDLARRSRSGPIRRAMIPPPGATVVVGPGYDALLIDFATNEWSLSRACERSPSLAKARAALRAMAHQWTLFTIGKGNLPAMNSRGGWIANPRKRGKRDR